MSEVTRDVAVVHIGRVAIDFGTHNQEQASRLELTMRDHGVIVTVDGKPA